MQHGMSENMEKFPCDPPPLYDTVQGQSFEDAEKGNVDPFTGKEIPDVLASGDPPPYKQEEFPSKSISSFNHLPPLIMRPWQSFFRTCLKCHWSVSADNFLYNLNYYQINYAWIMVTFVIIALVQWVWFIYRVLLSTLPPSFWIHPLICFLSPPKNSMRVELMWWWEQNLLLSSQGKRREENLTKLQIFFAVAKTCQTTVV